ncbi:hypothetical protein V8D89_002924 [Ganoderma adspersum]
MSPHCPRVPLFRWLLPPPRTRTFTRLHSQRSRAGPSAERMLLAHLDLDSGPTVIVAMFELLLLIPGTKSSALVEATGRSPLESFGGLSLSYLLAHGHVAPHIVGLDDDNGARPRRSSTPRRADAPGAVSRNSAHSREHSSRTGLCWINPFVSWVSIECREAAWRASRPATARTGRGLKGEYTSLRRFGIGSYAFRGFLDVAYVVRVRRVSEVTSGAATQSTILVRPHLRATAACLRLSIRSTVL